MPLFTPTYRQTDRYPPAKKAKKPAAKRRPAKAPATIAHSPNIYEVALTRITKEREELAAENAGQRAAIAILRVELTNAHNIATRENHFGFRTDALKLIAAELAPYAAIKP